MALRIIDGYPVINGRTTARQAPIAHIRRTKMTPPTISPHPVNPHPGFSLDELCEAEEEGAALGAEPVSFFGFDTLPAVLLLLLVPLLVPDVDSCLVFPLSTWITPSASMVTLGLLWDAKSSSYFFDGFTKTIVMRMAMTPPTARGNTPVNNPKGIAMRPMTKAKAKI